MLAAASAVGLVLSPAVAAPAKKAKAPAVAVSFDSLSTFTPAGADPKLAASFGSRGLSLTDFKFTPAAAKNRPSQVRVAIRARPDSPIRTRLADAGSASPVTALTPATYNLGAAVGWRRFAVSGDVAKIESRNPAIGNKESAVVGVSYSLKRFTGRVAVGAERDDRLPALRDRENYSLDVGGAYNITRSLAVTGGVRYNLERDRNAAVTDNRRDSQAVYLGTAFKF
ncbi:MAG: porin [Sphingomonas sp.]|nr:porin [Sphingomonas sp.]